MSWGRVCHGCGRVVRPGEFVLRDGERLCTRCQADDEPDPEGLLDDPEADQDPPA